MNELIINIIGYLAGFLNCITFIPQLFLMWKNKKSKNLSMSFLFINFFSSILWIIYGYYINSIHLMITDSVIGFVGLLVILSKLYIDKIEE